MFWLGAVVAVAIGAAAAVAALSWTSQRQSETIARDIAGGDPVRAPALLRRYGCTGCHTISGVPGADGEVGPPLSGLVHRVYIGGVAPNTPDHLVQWIISPQSLSPRSVMPSTGISEAEAHDVAAYLYSH